MVSSDSLPQSVRFVLNGLLATAVHYGALTFLLQVLHLPSAGISNMLAAAIGITTSFAGNRRFVFRAYSEPLWPQLSRFWILYAALSLGQGLLLFLWTDIAGFDYRIGFVLGVIGQAVCSYFGGRHWVFKPQA